MGVGKHHHRVRLRSFYPLDEKARQLVEALDPARAPGKAKTLKDMTPAERAEMERLYGAGSKK
jgi:hypothetical protein